MSILFPQQNQDYTLMSSKTNFKDGKAGDNIPEKRTVITINSDSVIASSGNISAAASTFDTDIYGTRYFLQPVLTTGAGLNMLVKSITVKIKKVGSASDLKIDLYKLGTDHKPTGSIITTATLQVADIGSSYDYELVTISGIYLEPNTEYGLVFRYVADGGDSSNYLSIAKSTGLANKFYLSTDGGNTWNQDADYYLHCNINYYPFKLNTFYIGNTYSYNATVSVFSYEDPDNPVQHDYVQNFIGFSTNSAIPDSIVTVQTDGIITGLVDDAGDPLVTGTTYYFDNATTGKIQTASNGKQVGKAIDTDKLLIIRDI